MLTNFDDDRKIRWMCRTVKELRESDVKTGLYVLFTPTTYPDHYTKLQYGIRPKGKVGGREIFMLGREFDAIQPVGTVECGSFHPSGFPNPALIVKFSVAHAPVTLYDESNPMQEPFDNKTIFYRSEARTPTLEESAVVRFAFS